MDPRHKKRIPPGKAGRTGININFGYDWEDEATNKFFMVIIEHS